MAALVKCCRLLRPITQNYGPVAITSRAGSYWNKDFMPGPRPQTAEERAAAAKKYGLLPEDYEPYPEDDAHGDYPKLPFMSNASKSEFEDWDIPGLKRNYGEPMHVDADILVEEKLITPRMRYSFTQMILFVVATIGGLYVAVKLTDPYKHYRPVMPKQLVGKGGPHYTFEQD
jgi:NADH dehydrogenase (ubiquinone) 1 beta subcomplex subunit 8